MSRAEPIAEHGFGDDQEAMLRRGFEQQAEWCRRLGSPFTALLCSMLGRRLDRNSAVGARVLAWHNGAGPKVDSVPLRIAGGLNALVRRGLLDELSAYYPPRALVAEDELWPALERTLEEFACEILPWLETAPQTNEVGRSAALMAGLLVIAANCDLPMSVFELGASAGLNLLLDRYSYRLGDAIAGDPASRLRLVPEWTGGSPPNSCVRIVARRGVDLRPLCVRSSMDRERLLAYVWPDQPHRVSQLEAALDAAAADPPVVEEGDAALWAEANIPAAPEFGVARVLVHTIAYQYFSPATQMRLDRHIREIGSRASARAPFARLRYEVERGADGPALTLTLWPGGRDVQLATGDPHVRRMAWAT